MAQTGLRFIEAGSGRIFDLSKPFIFRTGGPSISYQLGLPVDEVRRLAAVYPFSVTYEHGTLSPSVAYQRDTLQYRPPDSAAQWPIVTRNVSPKPVSVYQGDIVPPHQSHGNEYVGIKEVTWTRDRNNKVTGGQRRLISMKTSALKAEKGIEVILLENHTTGQQTTLAATRRGRLEIAP